MTAEQWSVTFDQSYEKERLPAPKFGEPIWWRDFPEIDEIVGQRPIINGEAWVITVAGFQGSDAATEILLHQEGVDDGEHDGEQEDAYFISGEGSMTRWDGIECSKGRVTKTDLLGIVSLEEFGKAKFELAVASYNLKGLPQEQLEHLVLNVEIDGRTFAIEPVSTLPGHYHATELKSESVYFVVKRKRVH